jgi:hypothetical protein
MLTSLRNPFHSPSTLRLPPVRGSIRGGDPRSSSPCSAGPAGHGNDRGSAIRSPRSGAGAGPGHSRPTKNDKEKRNEKET